MGSYTYIHLYNKKLKILNELHFFPTLPKNLYTLISLSLRSLQKTGRLVNYLPGDLKWKDADEPRNCKFAKRSKEDENNTATIDVSGANLDTTLPEIALKVLDKKILLNVYCEKRKGILTTIIEELEKYDFSVVTFSMIPIENTTMDITIVAQMENGFNQNLKDLTKTLRLALVVASPEH
ncbi:transcription factor bHLH19-like [Chenopodium quinoa]|uniref:transcription factor bHLH19-like n=1 Tax=Chenopodium quinoa TaxID=63459 RepID=UPI000B76C60C|nr:transcription factor bHLH19-like [Chenopodium quinoa]